MDVPRGTPAAILRPSAAQQAITVERVPAAPALAPYVDYHWYVGWRTAETHRQQVVPQPRVHVAAEEGRLLVHGISRQPFVRTLTGTGHTLGAAFHPVASGRCWVEASAPCRTRSSPRASCSRSTTVRWRRGSLPRKRSRSWSRRSSPTCWRSGPRPTRPSSRCGGWSSSRSRTGRSPARSSSPNGRGRSLRTLQRLFTDYVGIGPKWVVARFRILDAAAAAHGGHPVDWASLAAELGFTDQAHLTRAFTRVVGTPPDTYRREA